MNRYLHCNWFHDYPDDPVEMLYEIEPDDCVPRMIEVFRDGLAVANAIEWERRCHPTFQGTSLIESNILPIEEINRQSEFEARWIESQDFERRFHSSIPIINAPHSRR